MIRQLALASGIRSSAHRGPTDGIGRACGIPSEVPCCRRRNKSPASSRAAAENGGVLISPWSQASGLSGGGIIGEGYVNTDIAARAV